MEPITFDEAIARIESVPETDPGVEAVDLDVAGGRLLAQDLRLDRDQPAFDRATLDGYAVCPHPPAAAHPLVFRVVGTVLAGQVWPSAVRPGESVRIMTGAPCPSGTAVVPHEQTDRGTTQVTIRTGTLLDPGRNVAKCGEDGRRGAIVVAAGTRLGPATCAVAAMAGESQVPVRRLPRIAVVATGDELSAGGEAVPAGSASIADSNGPFLAGLAASLGLPCRRQRVIDDEAALRAALASASTSDVTVTTGGVSAGSRDLVPALARDLGFRTLFHGCDIQPGKPVLVARRDDGHWLVGLPGNPVSVLATAHLFLLPVLRKLGVASGTTWFRLPLAEPWQHRGARRLFLPARIDGGKVGPIRWNGSGDLIAAAAGDALIDLAPGGAWKAGEFLPVLPYVGTLPGQRGLLPQR
ncbi:molybdopterin molybdenumtransferase MoeA [Planctomycetota bacterium]|nr:molybdopterin molybdenumtransferase MoeA [Planctomycetota bacterium]